MSNAAKSSQYIILDACCLINLYASGRFSDIVLGLPERIAVASYVKEKEFLYIYGGPPNNVNKIKKLIDIEPLIQNSLIEIVSPTNNEEKQLQIDLAFELDDGEACTGALAVSRNWVVGTDDKKAITVFGNSPYCLPVVSSLELLKRWVDRLNLSSDEIYNIFHEIRTRASYEPGNNHPFFKWWAEFYHLDKRNISNRYSLVNRKEYLA